MKNNTFLQLTKIALVTVFLVTGLHLNAQLPGTWNPTPQTTTQNAVGIGTNTPAGWQEITYCDDNQNGLVVTNTNCPMAPAKLFPVSFDGVMHGPLVPGEGGPVFTYPPADFTLRPYGTYLNNARPMIWARMQNHSSFLSYTSGAHTSRFMVCPNGVAGINIEAPRATFDVKSLGSYNYPGLIVGRQNLSSPTRTQHLMFIPQLGTDGYNKISQQNDQGIFFTDGNGVDGDNTNGALVIAPWSNNNQAGGLRIDNMGNLEVAGTTRTTQLNINLKWWSDFVFESNYKLMTLTDVEQFIKDNKHLPNVPSECDLQSSGIDVAEMQAIQIQKIEELTLYAIQQEKVITEQTTEINSLEQKVSVQEKVNAEQADQLKKQQGELEELKKKVNLLLEAQLQNK